MMLSVITILSIELHVADVAIGKIDLKKDQTD